MAPYLRPLAIVQLTLTRNVAPAGIEADSVTRLLSMLPPLGTVVWPKSPTCVPAGYSMVPLTGTSLPMLATPVVVIPHPANTRLASVIAAPLSFTRST